LAAAALGIVKSVYSITEQYQYSTDIELYLTLRFPEWDMLFLNAGIGGDTAGGGKNRFASHVLDEKPTCVTIDFGMNDGGYGGLDKVKADNYIKNTTEMLEAAKKANVRVALISPNAVEVRARPNLSTYLETQQKFYAPLKDLAGKYQVPFVDQYAITRKALTEIAGMNAPVHPFPDGVHTNNAGGLLMAHTILVGLHAPAVVSDAVIDAAGKGTKSDNCTVSDLSVSEAGIKFVRTDNATPLPIFDDCKSILYFMNNLKGLNWYGLKVTGLKGDKYTLTIDGKPAGIYMAIALAAGVNLGNLGTGPLFDHGKAVFDAIQAKNNSVHARFREVKMATFPSYPWLGDIPQKAEAARKAELAKRMDEIVMLQKEIYKKAQPKSHTFELRPAK
jgi:lysophospholipase L1-like esterase